VLALEDGSERATLGQHGGDVLQAVDEHVDLAREERDLEFLRPERLAAEEVQRAREVLVALRRHERRAKGAVRERALQGESTMWVWTWRAGTRARRKRCAGVLWT
jgi:hypothetical protein